MRRWTAYYTDGRTFSSDGHTWSELPATGMLGIAALLDPPYKKRISGGDWYWRDPETGEFCCSDTTWDGYVEPPADVPIRLLKRGAAVPDGEWAAVQRAMKEAYR